MEAKNADLSALRIERKSEGPRFRLNIQGIIVTAVVLGVLAFLAVWGWNSYFGPAIEVKLTSATLTSPSQSNAILTASGYVVAQRKAAVASKTTGRMVFLGVVEGDKVKKDQVLARLEDADIRAQVDQARATLKMNQADLRDAEQSLTRQKELLAKGLTSQAEYDAADARYRRVAAGIDVAKAALASADVALEYTLIRAPFDGTVLTKNADVGEMVSPLGASSTSRAAVVTIADMTSLEVEADVSESNIERITSDQACEITLDAYPEQRYQGFVSKIVPTADRAKATVMVKVGFKSYDSRVLPEMSAKVLFLTKATDPATQNVKPFLTVASSAIVERSGKKVVYAVRENLAVEVAVETGRQIGSLTEITSGLSPGDKVINKVTSEIQQGVKVKVI
ncbi:MAG: Efflux RND transporter periplasmic adaptor subunit [Bacteroidetes bacterium]|nr:Efflux RND transporter periplasmic adaptor subunit [Bacteroidota bacterium]